MRILCAGDAEQHSPMLAPGCNELSTFIWKSRYRDVDAQPPERGIEDTWRRVAAAAASIEARSDLWRERFLGILAGFRFLPGGRILAGAGTAHHVTLFNCFVMERIEDSIDGIFESLKQGALTLQQGGGVGYDFSTLRPHGVRARTTGAVASGPVSFLHVWDAMCATMLSTGARRGAMMATLRCDHPDIEGFIDAKRKPGVLTHFNLSVLVTDALTRAVAADEKWPLTFPASAGGHVYGVIGARDLWRRLCDAAYDSAEPGVLFIDRINAFNNLGYCESLSATNPCGEQPLPPYGACNLGSINITAFVTAPFSAQARLDLSALNETAAYAVRFLDNVIDISCFPLRQQRERVRRARRVGLGITGLADGLAMLGLRYDSDAARRAAASVMETIRNAAYETSAALAAEKGCCKDFVAEEYLARPFIRALPAPLRAAIGRHGIRNSHLTAIAPAGTISLLANGVTSGIEPMFGIESERRVMDAERHHRRFRIRNFAYGKWLATHGEEPLPDYFVAGERIAARDHLLMQAALQPFVDGGISKTIALAPDAKRGDISDIFATANELGLKGCTVYRAGMRAPVVSQAR